MDFKQVLVDEFFRLVKIDSISGKEDNIARYLKQRLSGNDVSFQEDEFGNIVAKTKGVGAPIIISMHMDTVSPGKGIEPIIDNGFIKSGGETILGGDNKAAIAATLMFLDYFYSSENNYRPVDIVITKEEENISKGAKNFDYHLLRANQGFVLDSDDVMGAIILAAPCNAAFDVEIFGKAAHVKSIEQGISAIEIGSEIIKKLPLGRINKSTTVNCAFFKAGLKEGDSLVLSGNRNTVPNFCSLSGEIRSYNRKSFESVKDKIRSTIDYFRDRYQTPIGINVDNRALNYSFSKKHHLVKLAYKAFSEIEIEPFYTKSLGGSDANIFNEEGLELVVVSSAQHKAHQTDEYVEIDELVKLVYFIEQLVKNS